jgi:hypothetical protein
VGFLGFSGSAQLQLELGLSLAKMVVAPLRVTYFLVLSGFFHSVWEKCGHTMFFSVKFLPMQFEMLKVLKLKN